MKTLSAVALAFSLGVSALALAGPSQAAPSQCFRMSQMHGWKSAPDARGLYYRVGIRDVWFAQLANACPMLRQPSTHLVNKVTNDLICSPVEFDLRVADDIRGFPAIPCIVSSYRQLSPAEVAALPPKLRP